MDANLSDWLPLEQLQSLLALPGSELLLVGVFFVATAVLVALCVPGVLIPMAVSSGAILGAWSAAAAVVLGAVAGSQLFFLAARHFVSDRLRARLGERLLSFERRFADHGIWYVIALRAVGAPHLLVAGGSALMPIRPSSFAIATLIGLLPAVALGAATGSAI